MGLLTDSDSKVFRGWFEEMAMLHGFRVGYQYPLGDAKTIHSEPNMPMSIPIDLDIIFNENPTLDTLKKHGWVVEIGEQKPVVAQVPYSTPGLQRYSRIIIPSIGTVVDERIFEVTAISTIMEYPDCWTVRLAPVFKTIKEQHNYTKTNYGMMDVTNPGTQDMKLRPKDHAIYDSPEEEIDKTDNYNVVREDEQPTPNPKPKKKRKPKVNIEPDNVLGKDFNDFDS